MHEYLYTTFWVDRKTRSRENWRQKRKNLFGLIYLFFFLSPLFWGEIDANMSKFTLHLLTLMIHAFQRKAYSYFQKWTRWFIVICFVIFLVHLYFLKWLNINDVYIESTLSNKSLGLEHLDNGALFILLYILCLFWRFTITVDSWWKRLAIPRGVQSPNISLSDQKNLMSHISK
jgi:hypothetical protein